uniref:Uncharacterized protein n=1 Tax=Anguilla anguilla TaxID=7936 RepID=A0A0E9T347_ANGAN
MFSSGPPSCLFKGEDSNSYFQTKRDPKIPFTIYSPFLDSKACNVVKKRCSPLKH